MATITLVGSELPIEYWISRALDFRGYPLSKVQNIAPWYLKLIGKKKYQVTIFFPYVDVPDQYKNNLKGVEVV
jgi:hypothetical protein